MHVDIKNIAPFPRRTQLTTFDKNILCEKVSDGDRLKWRRQVYQRPTPVAVSNPHSMISDNFLENHFPGLLVRTAILVIRVLQKLFLLLKEEAFPNQPILYVLILSVIQL